MICVTGTVLIFLEIVRAVQRWHDSLLTIAVERACILIRTVCEDLTVLIMDWHLGLTMLTLPL